MWWFYFIACENKSLFFLNSPRSTVSLYHCESDNDFSNIDTIRTHSAGHGCEFVTGAETKHKYSKSVCACVFVYVHSFAISPFHRKTPSHSQHTVTKPWHHTYIHTRTHTIITLFEVEGFTGANPPALSLRVNYPLDRSEDALLEIKNGFWSLLDFI